MQKVDQQVTAGKGIDPAPAAARIQKLTKLRPRLAMVLGSGFHTVRSALAIEGRISYGQLPGFPPPGISGHAGELLVAKLAGTPVIVLSGRAHFYEGHPMSRVTFAVRVLAACGIETLLLTNAAGGVNPAFHVGDFMAITDHINFMGVNPLRGAAEPDLPRFVDLSCAYDAGLRRLLAQSARARGLKLRSGVYLAVCGPSYETPAEIRAFRRLGADAVGMSTVPEVILARQCGIRVAGLSCITNLAAGLGRKPLSHQEVLETAERVGKTAARLLETFAKRYGRQSA